MKTLLQEAPKRHKKRHVRYCLDMLDNVGKTCHRNHVAGTSQKTQECRVMKTFEDISNLINFKIHFYYVLDNKNAFSNMYVALSKEILCIFIILCTIPCEYPSQSPSFQHYLLQLCWCLSDITRHSKTRDWQSCVPKMLRQLSDTEILGDMS